MNFIQEVNALDGDLIILRWNNVGVIFKLLNVDDGYFGFAWVVVNHLCGFDVTRERFTGVYGMNNQAACSELSLCLLQQV